MPVYPVKRENKIEIMVSDEELKAFKEWAKKEGLTLSEYIRVAVTCDAFMSGYKTAWKITFYNASRKARELITRKREYLATLLGKTT